MKYNKGFTLIEIVITLAIASSLIAFSIIGISRFGNSIQCNYSINQVFADIKLTQQLADTSLQECKIEFKAGKNEYKIIRGNNLFRSCSVNKKIQFYGKSYFSFVPSGYTDVGGSGTLYLGGYPKVKKIIVSSRGRIRIE
jgi:prepilin-type N-terminal cleavage/methylation domain-containing protein